jgi:hypothetical protein
LWPRSVLLTRKLSVVRFWYFIKLMRRNPVRQVLPNGGARHGVVFGLADKIAVICLWRNIGL